jgi:hypothetical protein
VVVPDPGDIDRWLAEFGGELELYRDTGLHVDRAAAPHFISYDAGWQVVIDRNGIDVARDHNSTGPAEVRASHDCITIAK